MRRRNDNQARIIEFWRAVEMLDPPPVPDVLPSARVFRVFTGAPLPWQPGHELEHEPLPAGMTWRHTVYGGIFPLRRVREVLEEEFGAVEEPLDAPRPGDGALFAITLTRQGRPVLGTQELSCCAWAIGRLAELSADPGATGSTGPHRRTGSAASTGKRSGTGRSSKAGGSGRADPSGGAAKATRLASATGWWQGFGRSVAAWDRELERIVEASGDHGDGGDDGDGEAAEPDIRLTGGEVRIGRPLDHELLAELVERVEAELGVGAVLGPTGIRVHSVQVAEGAPYAVTSAGRAFRVAGAAAATAGGATAEPESPSAGGAGKPAKTAKTGKAAKVTKAVRAARSGKAGRAVSAVATGRARTTATAETSIESGAAGASAGGRGPAGKDRAAGKAITAAAAVDAAVAGAAGGDLNGPIVAELARVAAALGKEERGTALNAYLGGARSTARGRIDVRKDLKAVYEAVAPGLVPAARWPTRPGRALSLSQQFAVNTALSRLTGAPGGGLFSVNAPPGTGTTAVLRDLVAATVVERAGKLAALTSTYAAFGPTQRWKVAGETRVVTTWKEQLTGFEMVVATPQEASADTVAWELSGGSAIDEEWLGEARHYAALARRVLAAAERGAAGGFDEDTATADLDGGEEAGPDDHHTDWPRPAGAAEADADEPYTYDTYDTHAAYDTYGTDDTHDADETYPDDSDEPYLGEGYEPYEEPAWGLIAARLGDTRSRERFVQSFWLGDGAGGAPGMHDILQRPKPKKSAWKAAVRDFKKAERAAAELMNKRANVFRQAAALPDAEREQDRLEREHQRARQVVADLERRIAREVAPVPALQEVAADRQRERREHQESKPGAMGGLFGRRRLREWEDRDGELAAAAAQVEKRLHAAQGTLAHLRAMHASALQAAEEHKSRLDAVRVRVASAQSVIRRARRDLVDALPVADWWDDEERRERAAPWTDAAWNAARTRLFLAALELHRAFVAAEADRMRKNLQAAMDVLLGTVPANAPRKAVLAAWQSLFFVVPLVATTLASFDQVFSRLDGEALGWLFIDDGSQLPPHHAVAAIWRARRAVVIGDPQQLEPVITTPVSAQQALREQFTVSDSWLPGSASAQTLADQANRYGTSLPTRDGERWIGPAMRVHTRCDAPMFEISNAVAYRGLMINGVPARGPVQPEGYPAPPDSKWIDIPAGTAGLAEGHWLPEEAEELRFVLRRLRTQCGITGDRVMVLTPFREIADRLEEIAERSPGLAAGTVHAAAGRDADIVVFVLGGRPGADGAREWAAARPNLVNVAVSRARRRLYVIGDHAAWSRHRYFDTLADGLPVTPSIRPIHDFIDLEPGEPAGTG